MHVFLALTHRCVIYSYDTPMLGISLHQCLHQWYTRLSRGAARWGFIAVPIHWGYLSCGLLCQNIGMYLQLLCLFMNIALACHSSAKPNGCITCHSFLGKTCYRNRWQFSIILCVGNMILTDFFCKFDVTFCYWPTFYVVVASGSIPYLNMTITIMMIKSQNI